MIKLKRPQLDPSVRDNLLSLARAARHFYRRPKNLRKQQRFDLSPFEIGWLSLGFSKCAFCEEHLDIKTIHTGRYRPELAAREWPEGREWPEHYWWLAHEWANLLPICSHCSSLKRNFFPVKERGREGASLTDLAREGAMLIDPFSEDPARSIGFSEAGTAIAKNERGKCTIDLLSLNRPVLLSKRAQAIKAFDRLRDLKVIPPETEFAGYLNTLRKSEKNKKTVSVLEKSVPKRGKGKDAETSERRTRLWAKEKKTMMLAVAEARKKEAVVPTSHALPPSPGGGSFQYIRKVMIRNFRTIETLAIEIPQALDGSTTMGQSWKIVLGENSSGKSTVLKAIAIALVGQTRLNQLALDPRDCLRRWKEADGTVGRARKGHIKVEFLNGETHWVEFDSKKFRFRTGMNGMRGPVRAFGSMRLLPESGTGSEPLAAKASDVTNLFNPRQSLLDAERWLRSQQKSEFNAFAKALKALLGLERENDIEIADRRVWFYINGTPVRLDELSDGYQSMVALAVDFMSSIPNIQEMEFAEGIVLLDELGTHLHPRWRMDFVRRFRECFRRVQVIGTTHEPLCLLGLGQDEVMLLRRGPDGKVEGLDKELPNPAGMRADQILTSELFGLHSTIDPKLEQRFQQYYALLALPDASLDEKQRQERELLAKELRPYRALGFTRRDQVMYDFIDDYLAKELYTVGAAQRLRLKKKTMDQLRKLWAEVDIKAIVS
jgi:hypothetical protein